MEKYLAIDVGGTNIKYGLVTEEAVILEQGSLPTPKNGANDFLKIIEHIFEKYKSETHTIVMSAPGSYNAKEKTYFIGGSLRYMSDINITKLIQERMDCNFSIDNDSKCAALAELWKGSMKSVKNGLVITLGTGIGGSVIIDGKLYRGSSCYAGELSGISTNWTEAYTTKTIWSKYQSTKILLQHYAQEKGCTDEPVTGQEFFENVINGEPTACLVLDKFCTNLATGLFSLQLILDVQKISIGGGISKQPILIEKINQKMQSIYETYPYIHTTKPEICACTFGNDANLIGALYHYTYEVD